MGSLLLAAGEKGKRHALPNSSIMIHRTWATSISPFILWFLIMYILENRPFSDSKRPCTPVGAKQSLLEVHRVKRRTLRFMRGRFFVYENSWPKYTSDIALKKEKMSTMVWLVSVGIPSSFCYRSDSKVYRFPLEKALERDYFLTGILSPFYSIVWFANKVSLP